MGESSQRGTTYGYRVEFKHNDSTKWERIPERPAVDGVPELDDWTGHLKIAHLHSYHAAESLRHMFMASCVRSPATLDIETRLVKVKVEYSWACTKEAEEVPQGISGLISEPEIEWATEEG